MATLASLFLIIFAGNKDLTFRMSSNFSQIRSRIADLAALGRLIMGEKLWPL